jgi:hypothetical protein
MTRSNPSKRIAEARELLARMRAALLTPTPEAIDGELPALKQALQCLQELQPEAGLQTEPEAGLRIELEMLHAEVRRVAGLIEGGAALQAGWAKVLAAAAGGYTAGGEAAPLTVRGRLSLEG